jgi:hypothetical protein
MLSEVLFFLLYFRLSDLYFSNQFTFRSFHCSSLALLSLKNTIYYGKSILDPYHSLQTLLQTNQTNNATFYIFDDKDFCLKIIPIYFTVYLFYDLKHCHKRIELFIHHIICVLWAYTNILHFIGLISFTILAEGVTFAYIIGKLKNQLIYRLIFTFFVRFPIWTIILFSFYPIYRDEILYLYLLNITTLFIIFLMDIMWFIQNFKKLKQICELECECGE